jgi:uncharacterized membrane protein
MTLRQFSTAPATASVRSCSAIAGAAATLMCLWFNFVDLRREQTNLHRYLLGEIIVTTIMASVAALFMSAIHIPSGH